MRLGTLLTNPFLYVTIELSLRKEVVQQRWILAVDPVSIPHRRWPTLKVAL
jgi:hypothetical protein